MRICACIVIKKKKTSDVRFVKNLQGLGMDQIIFQLLYPV
jgi:hypothetical protein